MNLNTNIFEICSISQLEWRCFESHGVSGTGLRGQREKDNEKTATQLEARENGVRAGARALESQRKLCTVTPPVPLDAHSLSTIKERADEEQGHNDFAFFFKGNVELPRLWVFSVNGKDSIPSSIDGLEEVGMGQFQLGELATLRWERGLTELSRQSVGQYLVLPLFLRSLSKLVEPMLAPLGLVQERGYLMLQHHRNALGGNEKSRAGRDRKDASPEHDTKILRSNLFSPTPDTGKTKRISRGEQTGGKEGRGAEGKWVPSCQISWVLEGKGALQANVRTSSVRRRKREVAPFAGVRRSTSSLSSAMPSGSLSSTSSPLISWQDIPTKQKSKVEDKAKVSSPLNSFTGKKRPRSTSRDSKGPSLSFPESNIDNDLQGGGPDISFSSLSSSDSSSFLSYNHPVAPPSALLALQAAVDKFSKEQESPSEVWAPSLLLPDEYSVSREVENSLYPSSLPLPSALHSAVSDAELLWRRKRGRGEEKHVVSYAAYSPRPSLPWLLSHRREREDESVPSSKYYHQYQDRTGRDSPSQAEEKREGGVRHQKEKDERDIENALSFSSACSPEDIAWSLVLWKQMLLVPWCSSQQMAGSGPSLSPFRHFEGRDEEEDAMIEARPSTVDERESFLSLVAPIMKALNRLLSAEGKSDGGGVSLLSLKQYNARGDSGREREGSVRERDDRPSSNTGGRRTTRGDKEVTIRGNGKESSSYLESLTVPHLLVSFQEDSLRIPASVLPSWDYSQLKPYCSPKRVEYIALSPFSPPLLSSLRGLLREVSCTYQNCSLGSHSPFSLASEGVPIQKTLAGQTWLSSSSLSSSSSSMGGGEKGLFQPLRFSEDDAILLLPPPSTGGGESSIDEGERRKKERERIAAPYYEACKSLRSILLQRKKQKASVFDQPLVSIIIYVVSPYLGPLSSEENCSLLASLSRGLWEDSLSSPEKATKEDRGRSPRKTLFSPSSPPLSRMEQICSLVPFDSEGSVNIVFHLLDPERVLFRSSLSPSAKDIAFSVYSKTLVPKLLVQKSEVRVTEREEEREMAKKYGKTLLHGKNYLAFQPLSILAPPTPTLPPPSSSRSLTPSAGGGGEAPGSGEKEREEEPMLHGCYELVDNGNWLVFAWADSYGEVYTVNAFPTVSLSSFSSHEREKAVRRTRGSEKNGTQEEETVLSFACRAVYSYGLHLLRLLGPSVTGFSIAKLGSIGREELREWKRLLKEVPVASCSLLLLSQRHSVQLTRGVKDKEVTVSKSPGNSSSKEGGRTEKGSPSSAILGSSVLCLPRSLVSPVLSQSFSSPERETPSDTQWKIEKQTVQEFIGVQSAGGLLIPIPGRAWKAEGLGLPVLEDLQQDTEHEEESTVEVHLLAHWKQQEEMEIWPDKEFSDAERSPLLPLLHQFHSLSFLTSSPSDLRRRSTLPLHAHAVEQLKGMIERSSSSSPSADS